MLSVIALVALRLCIGWHFFYEGCWKVDNADKFSALPFLTMAKGPFAPIFYAMSPDLDGVERLKTADKEVKYFVAAKAQVDVKPAAEGQAPALIAPVPAYEENEEGKTEPKTETIKVYPAYFDEAEKIYQYAKETYQPKDDQLRALEFAWAKYVADVRDDVKDNAEKVAAYLGALERFKAAKEGPNNGPEQKKRQWADMMKLRGEAKSLLAAQEAAVTTLMAELQNVLGPVAENGAKQTVALPAFVVATDQLPFGLNLPFVGRSWTNFLDFAVTWALTLIGLCLILGFCTRLAAIGGGCFLISVLMTQPPWPTIFPAVHPEVGHALIVDKNFVEMVAIFMLATLPVGRWGGLDYFVWNFVGKPVCKTFGFYAEENED
ncbi:MAG: DoxX family protein [Thermoguttaceae bacterium]|nr:DoxX family protein [Thermoguttaceae bacterium]